MVLMGACGRKVAAAIADEACLKLGSPMAWASTRAGPHKCASSAALHMHLSDPWGSLVSMATALVSPVHSWA